MNVTPPPQPTCSPPPSLQQGQPHRLSRGDLDVVVRATAGYSASDLAALCKEAAMAPLREPGVMARLASLPASELRPIMVRGGEGGGRGRGRGRGRGWERVGGGWGGSGCVWGLRGRGRAVRVGL